MRTFLGIVLGIMGLTTLVVALFSTMPLSTLWVVAMIVGGAVMIWAAVVLFRSRPVDEVNVDIVDSTEYPNLRG